MLDKLHIRQDWAAVIAFWFGAAVIVLSLVALLMSLIAVAGAVF